MAKIHLSLAEQPDLLDIARAYRTGGGEFWVATEDGQLVGTIGPLVKENGCGVLKKFFVRQSCRGQGVGSALYRELLAYARRSEIRHLILDTPSVAAAARRFYVTAGFRRVRAEELPVVYTYPDRNSILYRLEL